MGQVMAAWDHLLGRDVALKRIIPRLTGRADSSERLEREARITGLLEHPAVVPVLDAGHDEDGRPYYVMRLIRGRTLAAAAAAADSLQARLRLLRHFLDACEAVGFAHSRGVVHRDLKPDNILVGEFGETQVADWGLARQFMRTPSQRLSLESGSDELARPDLTSGGAVVGTPSFMSPEQARGEPTQPASDVFSLGVVLLQLIHGQHPLAGRTSAQILRHLREERLPDIAAGDEQPPSELLAIAHRATEWSAANRYPNAKALAEDVARYIDGRLVNAHDYTPWQLMQRTISAWKAPLLVAAFALGVLAIGATVGYRRTAQQRDRAITAEAAALSARASADKNLADVLVRRASVALYQERRAASEKLAVDALERFDHPQARGILSGFAAAPAALRLQPVDLPGCDSLRPSVNGATATCRRANELSLWRWRGDRFQRAWRRRGQFHDAVVSPGTDRVAAVAAGALLVVGEREGADLRRFDAPAVRMRAATPTGPDHALFHSPSAAAVIPLTAAGAIVRTRCSPGVHLVVAALNAAATRLATFCSDGSASVVSLPQTGADDAARTAKFRVESGAMAAAWLPDSATLILAGRDGTVGRVDTSTGRVDSIAKFTGALTAVIAHPTRPIVAISQQDGSILIVDVRSGGVVAHAPAPGGATARFNASGSELWVFSPSKHADTDESALRVLQRWRLPAQPRPVRMWSGLGRPGLSSVAVHPAGDEVALVCGSGELRVHGINGELHFSDRFQSLVLKGAQYSADGSELLAWTVGSPSIARYQTTPWQRTGTDQGGGLKRAVLLASGSLLLASYGPKLSWLRGGTAGKEAKIVARGTFIDVDVTADRRRAIALRDDGVVFGFEDQDPVKISQIRALSGGRRVAISGDGERIAGVDSSRLRVWSAGKAASEVFAVAIAGSRTYGIDLDHAGRLLAASQRDGSARVWRVDDGQLLGVLRGHDKRVADVAFNKAGTQVVTASWDGSIRVWDLATLEAPIQQLRDKIAARWP